MSELTVLQPPQRRRNEARVLDKEFLNNLIWKVVYKDEMEIYNISGVKAECKLILFFKRFDCGS